MSVKIEGSRVLLTGATGGIGGAIARELHGRGATLVLTGRKAEVLEELRAELVERAEVLPADLARAGEAERVAADAGEVDILIANAGLPATGMVVDYSVTEIDSALDVNLRAPIQLTRALLPGMLERGSGQLVYMSSIAGKLASPRSALYSATKFALRGFTWGLRHDLAGSGVGVTCVYPGFVREAGMWADTGLKTPPGIGTSSPEEVARALARGIERNSTEVDVAPLFVRASARLSGAAPGLVASFQRLLGADKVADHTAEAQRKKR